MPDFFTRLAERTLGLANTIQPVLPSLFAPGAPVIDAEVETEQEITIAERAPQPGRAAPPLAIDAPIEQHTPVEQPRQDRQVAPRSVVGQPGEPPAPTIKRRAPTQPPIDSAPGSQPNLTAPHLEAHNLSERSAASTDLPAPPVQQRFDPNSQEQHIDSTQLTSTPDTAASIRASEQQRRLIDQPFAPSDSSARSLVPTERVDLGSPVRSTPTSRADEPQVQRSERRTAPVLVEQSELVVRERPQSIPRLSEPPVAQAAPQIHVSIGRIEVRAVTPPPDAAPQPRPAPTPRMSLDEYLRTQNGDRR